MNEIKFDKAEIWSNPGGTWLALNLDNENLPKARRFINSMEKEKIYSAELKVSRKKRSNNANAYCWVLLGELAKKLPIKISEIYRGYIKEIGGNYEAVCVQEKAADALEQHWTSNGIGWQVERLDSKIDGCVTMLLFYGSSQYNSAQMAKLIELIVQDCKEQGIETMTPQEQALLLERWKDAQEN